MAGSRTTWKRHPIPAAGEVTPGGTLAPTPPAFARGAVRRLEHRPIRWALGLAAVLTPIAVDDLLAARRTDEAFDDGFTTDATVVGLGGADADARIELTYTHPDLGDVEADALLWSASTPETGAQVEVDVDPHDPYRLALADDRPAPVSPLGWLILAATPLVGAVFLGVHLHRCRELAAGAPWEARLATITGRPGRGTRLLHLFPPDARTGDPPIATLRIVGDGTADLPESGPPIPVQIRSEARHRGRVVVRIGDRLLLPARRPRRRPSDRVVLPAESAAAPAVPPRRRRRTLRWRPAFAFVSIVLAVVATAVTLDRWRAAVDLEEHGTPVAATVIDQGGTTALVRFTLPEYERRPLVATAPASPDRDWREGGVYPARVDEDDLAHIRLLASPYEPVQPIAWAWVPFALVLLTTRRHPRHSHREPPATAPKPAPLAAADDDPPPSERTEA